ncbi:MAG: glycosyltransferase [Bacteroidota bacterium]|nr:glycosyltransferase [Bacteroidota bacterium]
MLSIVIIEYHSLDAVQKLYQSLQKVDIKEQYEVIASSNSLYDKAKQEAIQEEYSFARWTFNEKNGGFAYGMNQGLKIAKGDLLLITNPDVIIKSGVDEAIDFLKQHSKVGAVGPMIKDKDGEVQDSCRKYVTPANYIVRQLKRIFLHKDRISDYSYSDMQTADWIIGAFILMTREAYQLTQGLDDKYFMYAEDLDFCTRLRKAGKEIVYFPKMQVEYKGSSSARHSCKYAKIFLKSHVRYWNKFGYARYGGGVSKENGYQPYLLITAHFLRRQFYFSRTVSGRVFSQFSF